MANPAESKSTIGLKDMLKGGPHRDCFGHICKYLEVPDLLNLCDLDSDDSTNGEHSFTAFMINEDVMRMKLFDFIEFNSEQCKWSILQVFETFGKSMQRLKVSLSATTVNYFLRKIIRYCQPDQLIELTIRVHGETIIEYDAELLAQAQLFWHRLEKLTLIGDRYQSKHMFMMNHPPNLPNLKSLTLERFKLSGNWLQVIPFELSNIVELRMYDVQLVENMNEFSQLLNRLTNLEVFIHTKSEPKNRDFRMDSLADHLIQRFPELRGFGYDIKINFQIGGYYEIDHAFSFLERFRNLSELHIMADDYCQNLHAIFQYIPNIKVFSMWQVYISNQLPIKIRRIVHSIKELIEKRHDRFPTNNRVHIIASDAQYREFKAIKDINKFISLEDNSILPFCGCFATRFY